MESNYLATIIFKLSNHEDKNLSLDFEYPLSLEGIKSQNEFIKDFQGRVYSHEIEGAIGTEFANHVDVEITLSITSFDERSKSHSSSVKIFNSTLLDIDSILLEVYVLIEHLDKADKEIELEKQLQEINELLDEDEDIDVFIDNNEERISSANADELEEEKEQANPDSQLAHPTSERTEEVMLEQTWHGYDSEMTVDDEPTEPAPPKTITEKLWNVSGMVVAVCAGLSAVFITVTLGVLALHQVKTLF